MATRTEDTIQGVDLDRVLYRLREQAPEVMRKLRQLPPPDLAGLELAALHRTTSTDEAKLLMGAFLAIRVTAKEKTGKEVAKAMIEVVALFERARRSRARAPRRPLLTLVPSAPPPTTIPAVAVRPHGLGGGGGGLLSPRQTECLRLKSDGLETKEIARFLKISPHTVIQHLGDAYRRLGARNSREAVAAAKVLGIL
jgi:DNA-binding CsgD family transcriptional regulator